jgi:hypothetical protein
VGLDGPAGLKNKSSKSNTELVSMFSDTGGVLLGSDRLRPPGVRALDHGPPAVDIVAVS